MKRKNYLVAVGSVLLFLTAALTGCSRERKDGTVAENPNEIHIVVWESNNGPNEFIKRAAVEYHKLHPNIFVDYVHVNVEYASDEVGVDGSKGVGPDIFAAPHDRLGDMVTRGIVLPTVNPEQVRNTVLASCSKALTYNGTMYGYPVAAETYALFYNRDLISESEIPKNFADIVAWTKKFNETYPDKKGFVMDFNNGYYSIIFLSGDNNHLFGEEGTDRSKPNINTPTAIKGAEFFASLREGLNLGNMIVSSSSSDGLFVSGNAAMTITGLWNLKTFESAGVNFGVTTIPAMPGQDKPACSFSGTRGMFVSSYSRHPEEAADFAAFLLTPEMQRIRYETNNTMPSINLKVDNKYMEGFIKQLEYAYPMPSIPEMNLYWSHVGSAMYSIWNGSDPKTELDKLYEQFIK